MHIGILCPELHGHLNPMLAVAAELRRRGHRMTLVGIRDAERRTQSAGVEFFAIGESDFPLGSHAQHQAQLAKLPGRAALRFTIDLYVKQATVLLDEAPTALRRLETDSLLVDQSVIPGRTIAELLGMPFVNVCGALPLNRELDIPPALTGWPYSKSVYGRLRNWIGYRLLELVTRSMEALIADRRQKFNLAPYPLYTESFSNLAQVGPLPREFDFPRRQLPPCFHYAGPLHDAASRPDTPFPFDQLDGRPLIYASLGTLQNGQDHLYRAIAEACADLQVQLVISLGGGELPADSPSYPGIPVVVQFAPQLELVEMATVVITHAGMNTTMESLAHGKPLIAIPITNDQPAVAARILWTGCGQVIPAKKLTADRLQAAIQEVLSNSSYREAALRQQAAISRSGGVPRAADITEQALSTRQPVTANE